MRIYTTAPLEDPRDARLTFPALERAGYDGGFSFEAKHDPFLPLAVAAEHTRTLTLGTAVAIAFARNPMTLANVGWDLQALTAGRFVLGLGTQVRPHIERRFSSTWSHPAAPHARARAGHPRDLGALGRAGPARVRGRVLPAHADDPGVRSGAEPVRAAADLPRRRRAAHDRGRAARSRTGSSRIRSRPAPLARGARLAGARARARPCRTAAERPPGDLRDDRRDGRARGGDRAGAAGGEEAARVLRLDARCIAPRSTVTAPRTSIPS